MSMIFPIILMIILILCTMALYMSDIVSLRAYIQAYAVTEITNKKTEDVMENELKKELKDYTYITKITGIDIKKNKDNLDLKIDYKLYNKMMNINLSDSFNVEFHYENNREYIVKTKMICESVKNIGGVIVWK